MLEILPVTIIVCVRNDAEIITSNEDIIVIEVEIIPRRTFQAKVVPAFTPRQSIASVLIALKLQLRQSTVSGFTSYFCIVEDLEIARI
jgi:hypothetical protein